MITNTKAEELTVLSDAISDYVSEKTVEELMDLKIKDDYHILSRGSPDSDIMIVWPRPDNSEVCWGERDNSHTSRACTGPDSYALRKAIINSFGKDDRVFYLNLVPFMSLGDIDYTKETILKMRWIYERAVEIVRPKLICIVGFDAFHTLIANCDKLKYWELVKDSTPLYSEEDCIYYLPLEHPKNTIEEEKIKTTKYTNSAFRKIYARKAIYTRENSNE